MTFAVTFKDAKPVLGVRSLQDLGFKVDPVAGALEPTRPPAQRSTIELAAHKGLGWAHNPRLSISQLERFQENVGGRLKTWKEEDHEADKALREMARTSSKP